MERLNIQVGFIKPSPSHYIAIAVVMGVICVLTYFDTFSHSFVYDDHLVVAENRSISRWQNLGHLFSVNYFHTFLEASYRPIVTMSYMLDYALWRDWPGGYHLMSVLYHAMTCTLLSWLVLAIFQEPIMAFLAGLFMALHPINSEAVNAVAFREDILAAMLAVAAVLWYFTYRFDEQESQKPSYIMSSLILLMALLSKESAVVVVLWLGIVEYSLPQRLEMPRSRRWQIGILIPLVVYLIIRFIIFSPNPYRDPQIYPGLNEYFQRIIYSVGLYIKSICYPWPLNVEYPASAIPEVNEPQFISAGVLVIIFVSMTLYMWKARPQIGFLLMSFGISLLPVSNIIPLDNWFAERYCYLPCVPAAVIFAYVFSFGFQANLKRTEGKIIYYLMVFITAGIFSISALVVHERNRDWRNEVTLWTATRKLTPNSARVQTNYGAAMESLGKIQLAQKSYQKAIELDATYGRAYLNLGSLLYHAGEKDEALAAFRRGWELEPRSVKGAINLANLLINFDNLDEAHQVIQKSLEHNGMTADLALAMGKILYRKERYEEALHWYQQAADIEPDWYLPLVNMGLLYQRMMKPVAAEKLFRKAAEMPNAPPGVWNNLGGLLLETGRKEEAIGIFQEVLEGNPNMSETMANLYLVYNSDGQRDKALEVCREALGQPLESKFRVFFEKHLAAIYREYRCEMTCCK